MKKDRQRHTFPLKESFSEAKRVYENPSEKTLKAFSYLINLNINYIFLFCPIFLCIITSVCQSSLFFHSFSFSWMIFSLSALHFNLLDPKISTTEARLKSFIKFRNKFQNKVFSRVSQVIALLHKEFDLGKSFWVKESAPPVFEIWKKLNLNLFRTDMKCSSGFFKL